jgi:crotonobetainyl-CoA:carnitine CoA-transferase CaiB-like acyl-CoA transferase
LTSFREHSEIFHQYLRIRGAMSDLGQPGPLDGIRVVDLTHVLSGPLCTYQLALLGAEVTKIENPDSGDMYRRLGTDDRLNAMGMGLSYVGPAGGKLSVALNLKDPRGIGLLRRMIAVADILVQNYRPGVAERMGIGYDACREINPSLVYCAISGFGQTGPYRDHPAVDHTVQGMSGMMAVTGPRDGPPVRVGYAAADTAAGLVAGIAVLGGLVGAIRTGRGCFLDVSMLEACLVAQATVYYEYLNSGHVPPRVGSDILAKRGSGGTFRTEDGFLVVSALSQDAFEKLCAVVGRRDLPDDPRFRVNAGGLEHAAELRAILADAFSQGKAREWERKLVAAGIPAGVLNQVPEVAAHPQLRERGAITEFAQVTGIDRGVKVLNAGYEIDGRQLRPRSPPPMLGADTRKVLLAMGLEAAEIAELECEGVIRCAGEAGAAHASSTDSLSARERGTHV